MGFLQRSGRLDHHVAAAAQVTPANVDAYVAELTQRVRSVTIWNCVYKLRRAAELLIPGTDYGWIAELEKDLDLVMVPRSKSDRLVFNGVLVMCEVMMPDGTTPHPSNKRATILDDPGAWFGFEQEYFFYKDGRPLGFPPTGYPAPQGPYYTGVGYKNVGDIARKIVDEHLDLCLAAGINHEGINAQVAKGQMGIPDFRQGLQARRR